MVSVGSMIILLISATSLGFNPFGTWIDSTNVDISTEKYQEDTGVKVTDRNFNINDYKGWVDRQKRKNGIYKKNIDVGSYITVIIKFVKFFIQWCPRCF